MSGGASESQIQRLAAQYHCDLNDPIFALWEKMADYHAEVREKFQDSFPKEKEVLTELVQKFETQASKLSEIATQFRDSSSRIEHQLQVVAESAQGLTHYWKQIHLRYAFLGVGITLLLCGGAFGLFYFQSADRLLTQAGVNLKSEAGGQGKRLKLSGKKLLSAGQSNSEIVVEFAP